MKWIKKFNEAKEGEYFWTITTGDYSEKPSFDGDFEKLADKIKSIISKFWSYPDFTYFAPNKELGFILFCIDRSRFSIKPDADEYFRVRYSDLSGHPDYYECDQFEGLLKLLSYLGVVPDNKLLESVSDNEYYWNIDAEVYSADSEKNRFDVDFKQFTDKIKKLIGPDFYNFESNIDFNFISFFIGGNIRFVIKPDADEYFRVACTGINLGYYQCDQWEGLIKLLTDFGAIKEEKLLESVSDEYVNDNEYYHSTTSDEYSNGKLLGFDDKLLKSIESLIVGASGKVTLLRPGVISFEIGYDDFFIKYVEDDWFIVRWSRIIHGSAVYDDYLEVSHYKCDQFEGLVKLLTDLGLTK